MSLDLTTFLIKKYPLSEYMRTHTVVCFTGDAYPLLFFMHLKKTMPSSRAIETIDCSQSDVSSITMRLSTLFLGRPVVYFLTGIDDCTAQTTTALLNYLRTYTGPNSICFFNQVDQQQSMTYPSAWLVIDISSKINKKLFGQLVLFYGVTDSDRVRLWIDYLFKSVDIVSLEQACLLIHYIPVSGYTKQFFTQWIESIITPEQSLFTLSQYFFQKKAEPFFTQLKQMEHLYASPFWTVFWSEQLWRASMFMVMQNQNERAQARKVAFRLPFSFINRDWHSYTAAELINAHDFLYMVDYRLKNGGTTISLDFFYSQFFSNGFITPSI